MRYERVLAVVMLLGSCGFGCSASSEGPSSQDAVAVEQEELAQLGASLRALAGDKVTRFDSADDLAGKRAEIYRQYKLDKATGKALRDGLGTLGDLVRPEEAMALASLGSVYVGDTMVSSAEQLLDKARMKLAALHAQEPQPERATAVEGEQVGQTAQALTDRSWQAEDRQYPYKMIGTSYHDTTWVEGQVGAKTEFQKHR